MNSQQQREAWTLRRISFRLSVLTSGITVCVKGILRSLNASLILILMSRNKTAFMVLTTAQDELCEIPNA